MVFEGDDGTPPGLALHRLYHDVAVQQKCIEFGLQALCLISCSTEFSLFFDHLNPSRELLGSIGLIGKHWTVVLTIHHILILFCLTLLIYWYHLLLQPVYVEQWFRDYKGDTYFCLWIIIIRQPYKLLFLSKLPPVVAHIQWSHKVSETQRVFNRSQCKVQLVF